MAQDDDTPPRLRGPPPGATEPPDHVKKPQIYEIFHGSSTSSDRSNLPSASPGEPATEGQAGRQPRPTLKEGFESIKSDDFLKVHQIPCAREGLMTGMGAGAVVGAGEAQRRKERAAMARVVEVIDRKQAEKKAQAAEAARLKREAEEKEKTQQAQKSWYKFW
ncbi:hypothetical protein NPX13_g10683 [Xylaria arbuscula]|uniref:Cytochrome c oxidase assembly protein COX20, mitochondrial n=1 Tax=Xylaria arbuscula TaxID=114810 RepID=A0A9W8THP1_9PEZI|nr:hypothetical protein NPX13_g10683 [Xylaria arbuscula]